MTKLQYLNALTMMVENAGVTEVNGVPVDEMLEFLQGQAQQVVTKAEKAREKAAEKRAKGDDLRIQVYNALDENCATAEVILARLQEVEGREDLTVSKVRARLTQLVQSGAAIKEQIKVNKRVKVAYKVA